MKLTLVCITYTSCINFSALTLTKSSRYIYVVHAPPLHSLCINTSAVKKDRRRIMLFAASGLRAIYIFTKLLVATPTHSPPPEYQQPVAYARIYNCHLSLSRIVSIAGYLQLHFEWKTTTSAACDTNKLSARSALVFSPLE
jgi:hypothetical protein